MERLKSRVELWSSKKASDFTQGILEQQNPPSIKEVIASHKRKTRELVGKTIRLYRGILRGNVENSVDNRLHILCDSTLACSLQKKTETLYLQHSDQFNKSRWDIEIACARMDSESWRLTESFDPGQESLAEGISIEDRFKHPFCNLVWKHSSQYPDGTQEVRILKTLEDWHFVRIEEKYNANGKSVKFCEMIANQVEVSWNDESVLEEIKNQCAALGRSVQIRGPERRYNTCQLIFTSDFYTPEFPPLWVKEMLDRCGCTYRPEYIMYLE
ncbi:MAG: hypothetical protein KGI80_03595 [Verrucomicrobiota bacterium]|nr:hypothetical protein [Verrucomicrobiota bacterium]